MFCLLYVRILCTVVEIDSEWGRANRTHIFTHSRQTKIYIFVMYFVVCVYTYIVCCDGIHASNQYSDKRFLNTNSKNQITTAATITTKNAAQPASETLAWFSWWVRVVARSKARVLFHFLRRMAQTYTHTFAAFMVYNSNRGRVVFWLLYTLCYCCCLTFSFQRHETLEHTHWLKKQKNRGEYVISMDSVFELLLILGFPKLLRTCAFYFAFVGSFFVPRLRERKREKLSSLTRKVCAAFRISRYHNFGANESYLAALKWNQSFPMNATNSNDKKSNWEKS